jgi:glycosyltransferase involved in cell wall biosynthesis
LGIFLLLFLEFELLMASKEIFLSIIFPLYNAADDVEGVFSAIANQTNIDKSKMEVVVIDDGSTDETNKLIDENKKLFKGFAGFKKINHKTNLGLAQSRFDGASAAKGKYVTFADKKTRADQNYLSSFIGKKYDIIIGDVYMDKSRSIWDRIIILIKKKLYYPYFNHPFKDLKLDHTSYLRFKNKGGGAVMFVRRDYFMKIAENMDRGKDVNDDTLLVEGLSTIKPILKTSSARVLYLNRVGFKDNFSHIYRRGPKFVDYYTKPGTRFFWLIVFYAAWLVLTVVLIFVLPVILLWELAVILVSLVLLAGYLAEEIYDFLVVIVMFPVLAIAFFSGITKGLLMKLFHRY